MTAACASRVRASAPSRARGRRSEEHTSEPQSQSNVVCRLLLEKKIDFSRMLDGLTKGHAVRKSGIARDALRQKDAIRNRHGFEQFLRSLVRVEQIGRAHV